MNIIEIANLLSIDSAKIGLLAKADFVEKQILLETEKIRHHLRDEQITTFIKVLKKHPSQFQEVMNNRALFNYFAKKNLSKKQFPKEVEIHNIIEIKTFIQNYLIDDLVPVVYDKIDANDFEEIALLTEANHLLPDEVSEKIVLFAVEKLELADKTLKPPFDDFSKILYIKDAYFFTFLNGFKDEIIEEKVKKLFTAVMNMYIENKSSDLAKCTFTAMKNYHALDEQLSKNIEMLKESAEINYKPFAVNHKKYYWIYTILGLLIVIRGSMFISDISKLNSQFDNYQEYENYETEPDPIKIDRYYTNMKFKIDSFRVFLADYNQAQIKRLTMLRDIKTGQNPFQTIYDYKSTEESSNFIKFKDTSNYDIVLLENAVMYDSIKIPKTAHFVKSGETVEVSFLSSDAITIFNIYMGKKLATFQTESNHLFIRNGSVVEYRFSELIPNVKEVLETDYIFKNDAVIDFKKGQIRVDSKGVIAN